MHIVHILYTFWVNFVCAHFYSADWFAVLFVQVAALVSESKCLKVHAPNFTSNDLLFSKSLSI